MSIPITATSPALADNQVNLPPVVIFQVRLCQYKAKVCRECGLAPSNPVHRKKDGTCKLRRQMGCAHCGKAKSHRDHLGVPPSLNILGSGNAVVFAGLKKTWSDVLLKHLVHSGLPRDLESVIVECEITFPDLADRDEGNARFLIEKALGDVLVTGGWLVSDTFFPVRHYTFGAMRGRHEPGVSAVRLTIFPTASAS